MYDYNNLFSIDKNESLKNFISEFIQGQIQNKRRLK